MAARKNRIRHDDRAREKIQVTQLTKLLQADALGKKFGNSNGPVQLSDGRRKSIEILLRKALPDLSAVEHTGDIETSYVVRMPTPAKDLDEWTTTNTEQDQHVSADNLLSTPKQVTH